MYKITSYGKNEEYVHFCSTYTLAQAVAENLDKRDEAISTIETTNESVYYWFGRGTIIHYGKYFGFKASNSLQVKCFASQWKFFKKAIKIYLEDEYSHLNFYDGKFYKIIGNHHALCLSRAERDTLISRMYANESRNDKTLDGLLRKNK